MKEVFIIEGWMGNIEWIEGVYADEQKAEATCAALWKDRKATNPTVPAWTAGFCKFAVVNHTVIQ